MNPKALDWLHTHTWSDREWSLAQTVQRAQARGTTVSVILPALNEAATIGSIVAIIKRELMDASGLVSQLIVVDSGSIDDTAAIARNAGAEVITRESQHPHIPVVAGKGEAMWRGLAHATGDIVVFIDADLQSFNACYVVGLVAPLLHFPELQLVKAVYERPLLTGESVIPAGGGRVTELVARPLLNRFWPELAGVVQPLAGEYAARRSLLRQLAFPTGYGVETALLLDTYRRTGLDGIGQVDLGVRVHRHQSNRRLGIMAAEILDTLMRRVDTVTADQSAQITQFDRTPAGYVPRTYELEAVERPALDTLA